MVSIAELRKKVQVPVRRYNDVAGLLVGDRVSIHITRLFIALGLSPTVATVAMLICGLAGSALIVFGGLWSVAGFALLVLYYVFDCVDGEVARYHGQEKFTFAFVDFLFHLAVKPSFYVAVGVLAARTTGHLWTFAFGLAALLATLLGKFLHDAHVILVSRMILLRGREERKRYVRELLDGADAELAVRDVRIPGDADPYRPRGILPFVRVAAANFDLGLIVFLVASVVDLFVPPFELWGAPANVKVLVVVFYGIVLPLDFVDHLIGYVRGGLFVERSRTLLRRAHHFRVDEGGSEGPDDAGRR
jgi:hypothetical protein